MSLDPLRPSAVPVSPPGQIDNSPPAAKGHPRTADLASQQQAEQELVAAVLRKDRKASAEFVARFAESVAGFVHWRLSPNTDAADDLVQDVFLEAWRSLERFRGESGLKQWMIGIARHKVQDHYRKVLRHASLPEEEDAAPLPELVASPEFAQAVQDRQRSQAMQQVLAELPETYRVVLQWRYWEQQSGAAIGQRIGRTEKAVERLLARARTQFREQFERLYGGVDTNSGAASGSSARGSL